MSSDYIVNILGIAGFMTVVFLALALFLKMKGLRQLQLECARLRRSLDEMDEQAKLIVRTDMELNKTQDELDKKMSGLYALQRLSRSISTTLEENQIFKILGEAQLEDLSFEKACAFLWDDFASEFRMNIGIGYTEEEAKNIALFINANKNTYQELIRSTKTISTLSAAKDTTLKDKINSAFGVHSFVATPLLPKEGSKGFLFVGTDNADVNITEGDEELITILANQLSQALENARLFEKTWGAQQELEKKVEERTRELTLALEELKRTSKRKTDFISAVSHELRTPLTSIKGYASILLAEKLGKLPGEAHERIEKINRHSDELTHMVNDLLDIARIESGKMLMQMGACELKNIAEEISDLFSPQLKEKRITLSVNIAGNANTPLADTSQIKRVFINIIGNAIKFTPEGGRITISSHRLDDKNIQVDITDTGCGIPLDAQDAIFEEFYRVDNSINQEVKGTGLGLAVVKRIIQAHNGKIWVKSVFGNGSTFSFTLPQAG